MALCSLRSCGSWFFYVHPPYLVTVFFISSSTSYMYVAPCFLSPLIWPPGRKIWGGIGWLSTAVLQCLWLWPHSYGVCQWHEKTAQTDPRDWAQSQVCKQLSYMYIHVVVHCAYMLQYIVYVLYICTCTYCIVLCMSGSLEYLGSVG